MIPRLHLILNLEAATAIGRDPLWIACAAVKGGVGAVHVRSRSLPARAVLDCAQRLRTELRGTALVLVNDRLDVALASGADGVHLPAEGLPPAVARALIARHLHAHDQAPRSSPMLIGCSVHDASGARLAARDGADFLLLGTVFASRSHPERAPGGEELVRAARAATGAPLIAIGGITADTAPRAMAAGADGVAVLRAIVEAPDPAVAAAAIAAALETCTREAVG